MSNFVGGKMGELEGGRDNMRDSQEIRNILRLKNNKSLKENGNRNESLQSISLKKGSREEKHKVSL